MDELVTVHGVALGCLTQCFHETVTAVCECVSSAALTSDGGSSPRLQPSSLFSSPRPFVSAAVNDASLAADSHGRQPFITKSADITPPVPFKLHWQFYKGLTCYHRHCCAASLPTVITLLCYYTVLQTPAFTLALWQYHFILCSVQTMISRLFFPPPTPLGVNIRGHC